MLAVAWIATAFTTRPVAPNAVDYDIVTYEATSAGIVATAAALAMDHQQTLHELDYPAL